MLTFCQKISLLFVLLSASMMTVAMLSPTEQLTITKNGEKACFQIPDKHFKRGVTLTLLQLQMREGSHSAVDDMWRISGLELYKGNCLSYGDETKVKLVNAPARKLKINKPYSVSMTLRRERNTLMRLMTFSGAFCLKEDNTILKPYYDQQKKAYICAKKPSFWQRWFK